MGERQSIKLEIRKEVPMSEAGFNRLSQFSKLFFRKRVFKSVFSGNDGEVDCSDIEDGRSLARWLFSRFGGGLFIGFSWRYNKERTRKQYTKALFRVRITPVPPNAFDYDFISTKGISKYSFWLGEY